MCFSVAIYSQNKQPTQEEKDMIYSLSYNFSKEVFNTPDFPFKKVKQSIGEILKQVVQPSSIIESSIDTLISRAVLKLEKSEYGYDLLFKSRFPSYYKEIENVSIVDFHPVESKLFNFKKELIKVMNVGGTSFGNESFFKYKNGKTTDLNFTTLDKQDQINNSVNFENNNELSEIKGSVIYNIKFITGYSQVKLSSKDIGLMFKLNSTDYKLIDIINNVIVIELVDLKNLGRENEIFMVNYDATGNVLVNYSHQEVQELKKKDNKINTERAGYNNIKGEVSKRVFLAFKSNPSMTFLQYQNLFLIDDIINDKNKYIFIQTIAPIKNNFILYEPIYGIDRTFELVPNALKPEPKKLVLSDYSAPQLSANWGEVLWGNVKEYTENVYYASKRNGKYVKGKMQNFTTFKKNSNGEFVKEEMFPKKSDYPENKYNALKQKIESITFDDEDNVMSKIIYSYNDKNQLITEGLYNSTMDTLLNLKKYEYKQNQTTIKERSYFYMLGNLDESESQTLLLFDGNKNLVEEHSQSAKENLVFEDALVFYYKYNSDNRKIESSHQDFQWGEVAKLSLDTKMKYIKIDDRKNWTEMFIEDGLGSESPEGNFIERIFVYE